MDLLEGSTIRRARLAHGVGVRELARRLGVTPGAVSQMERSEAKGVIQMDTLQRALAAVNDFAVAETTPAQEETTDDFVRREDRIAWELHIEIAKKLLANPDAVRNLMPANVENLRAHVQGRLVNEWLDRWLQLSSAPLGELLGAMLATDETGREMRQNGPFMGVLSQVERVNAIHRATGTQ